METKPIPTAGQGQVRVRVKPAPINPNDLHVMRGRYGIASPMPTPSERGGYLGLNGVPGNLRRFAEPA